MSTDSGQQPQPQPRARVSSGEARRRIVEAAGRLLLDRRFRDLTVEDVMAEAGLTRTVFYRHFDGLPAIVLGLLDELVAGVAAEADTGDPDDPGTLRRSLALAVATFREHGRLLLAFDEAARSHADVELAWWMVFDHAVEMTTGLIERGVALGHAPPLPAADVAHALTAMNSRYLLNLVARDPEFDVDAALEALLTVWARTTWPSAEGRGSSP